MTSVSNNNKNDKLDGKFYTTVEVSQKLKVRRITVERFIRRGVLKAYKFGRTWRIAEVDLLDFLKESNA